MSEKTNHLSNTLITLSDNKIGVDAGTDNTADYYEARVLSATDYYAFGMAMKERSWQSESYRYGFNGKEKDKDFGDETTDFGARLMNSKIGRWMVVDPLAGKYPSYSSYVFCLNNPIVNIDPDGKRVYFVPGLGHKFDEPSLYVKDIDYVFKKYGINIKILHEGHSPGAGKLSYFDDMAFVLKFGQTPALSASDNYRIKNLALEIALDIHKNPLNEEQGEKLNLIGASQGSVVLAQAAIQLLENPEAYGLSADFTIDNLILAGSPIDEDSELYGKLKVLNDLGKIKNLKYKEYQANDGKGNYTDNITGVAGTSKMQGLRRGLKAIVSLFKAAKRIGKGLDSGHPHVDAALGKATNPNYTSFGEQIAGQSLVKDKIEGDTKAKEVGQRQHLEGMLRKGKR